MRITNRFTLTTAQTISYIIIQQTRLHDGSRKVTAISEITGMEGGIVTMQEIFKFTQKGFDKKGKVIGYHEATGNVPKFVHLLRRRGIDVDMTIFQNKKAETKTKEEPKSRSRRRR